jgi:uncharacterized membrane protein YfcA
VQLPAASGLPAFASATVALARRMILPIDTMAIAALIVIMAYTVYGLTGFGASITGMPLLVLLVPLQLALPMMLIFDLLAGLMVGLRNRRSADLRELMRLMPYLVVGMALGVTVLVNAPEAVLLLVLGIFILSYSAWSLIARPSDKLIATGWSPAFGIGGGMFTALFGTGGPIYTVYLSRRVRDKVKLRATISLVILIAGSIRLAFFSSVGFFSQSNLLQLILLMLPCSLLGLFIGSHLHQRMPANRARQAVWLILVLGGVSLIRQSLMKLTG